TVCASLSLHDALPILIEFVDVTAVQVIYRAAPIADSVGHIHSVPISRLYGWTRLGAHIAPDHRYRVTVYYDNPTGQAVPDGGMEIGRANVLNSVTRST